ncbi:serine hydrolase domain-containing protein [Streptomyces yaizuensis]|uniref:Serine hydrolase n=1 Tax=Streptomyces yaizuensis TaxID=2989713 RepID=A0ABQ5NX69_9ACTN|nr:serine hydrolase domain-containing protein [Streptomyces sp. YSPA8]GLF94775.1 serine hydrolase [Streptomyces sp. YSPA8]
MATEGAAAEPSPGPTAFTCRSGASPPADGFAELDEATAGRLDRAIRKVMDEAELPGVIAGVRAPGKGDYVRAFGTADKATGAPMATDLNMRIGSVTKTFTVTALLKLVDEGRVALDDTVGRYVAGVPNGDRITLRDLAGMRSGLFNYSEDEDFFKALTTDPERPFTPRELLDYSFRHPVRFEPDARFEYSNTNLILVGLVVERVSGTDLDRYVQQHILTPHELTRTSFPTGAEFPAPHAQGYTDQTADGREENATDWNPSWGWAAGAMISDLADLRRWAPLLATGHGLVSDRTQRERLTLHPTTVPDVGYGLGIFMVRGWVGHNGSLPGYEALTLYLCEQRATMVVLVNTDTGHGQQEPSTLVGEAITEIVSPGHVYDLPQPGPPSKSPSPGG